MPQPDTSGMRDYWNERARQNAACYVDTSVDYENGLYTWAWARKV